MHYSYKYLCKKIRKEKDGIRKIDGEAAKEVIECGSEMQDQVEYLSLLDDIEILDAWCQKNQSDEQAAFFQFFQDSIIAALYRYQKSKGKVWSKKRNWILWICSAIIPVLSGIGLQWLSGLVSLHIFSTDAATAGATGASAGTLVGGLVVAAWIAAYIYKESYSKREYNETWVRHSACYARLHLALSRFVVSTRTADDYNKLVSDTFDILNQNLDQFTLNLSKRGLAARKTEEAEEE